MLLLNLKQVATLHAISLFDISVKKHACDNTDKNIEPNYRRSHIVEKRTSGNYYLRSHC